MLNYLLAAYASLKDMHAVLGMVSIVVAFWYAINWTTPKSRFWAVPEFIWRLWGGWLMSMVGLELAILPFALFFIWLYNPR